MKTTFINSKNVFPPEDTINEQKVEKFISMFNDTIRNTNPKRKRIHPCIKYGKKRRLDSF